MECSRRKEWSELELELDASADPSHPTHNLRNLNKVLFSEVL